MEHYHNLVHRRNLAGESNQTDSHSLGYTCWTQICHAVAYAACTVVEAVALPISVAALPYVSAAAEDTHIAVVAVVAVVMAEGAYTHKVFPQAYVLIAVVYLQ